MLNNTGTRLRSVGKVSSSNKRVKDLLFLDKIPGMTAALCEPRGNITSARWEQDGKWVSR